MTHLKGPLLEESHYYPFGTEMSGISSHSLPSYVPNRYKANAGADCVPIAVEYREYGRGEWSNGGGLEMYETYYRSYNAQIGRFMQGDPMMEVSMESYVFGKNNPVFFTDFNGALEEECKECKLMDEIVIKKYSFSNAAENVSDWVDLLLASSGVGGSSDWSFLGENGGGGGNSLGSKRQKIDTIPRFSGVNSPKDKFRGGSKKDRDRSLKDFPIDFQRWYHKGWKEKGDLDLPRNRLEELYKDWQSWGEPKVKTVAVWTIIGIGLYETAKWGVAIFLAPETAGGSLVGAAAIP